MIKVKMKLPVQDEKEKKQHSCKMKKKRMRYDSYMTQLRYITTDRWDQQHRAIF